MNDVIVTRHKYHIVRSLPGCTVRQEGANGTVIETTVPADEDTPVFAHSGRWTVEGDENVTVTEVFKLAPQQRLALLGVLGGNVPSWLASLKDGLTAMLDGSKFELAWLAGEKTLVVHTDRLSDDLLVAVKAAAEAAMPEGATLVQYNHNMEISWRDINKYADCKTFAQMYAVDHEKFETQDLGWTTRYIINDLTSDGDFVYPLTSLVRTENGVSSSFVNVRANPFSLTLPSATDVAWCFQSVWRVTLIKNREFELIAPNATNAYYTFAGNDVCIRKIKCYLPLVTRFDCFARHSYTVEEVEGDFSSASTGSEMFSGTRLNKKSALNVLTSIPSHASGSHPLTIGIHIDHQNDEEVQEAIANAEEKGWTLSVQWNGTPTSTASTMAMGTLIYAKVGEMERPDGTTEQYLDWGHYVTNWEARGYEQFRSLESAYRYFNLPDVPEETLTETE